VASPPVPRYLEDGPSLFATREGTPVDESSSLPPSSAPSRSPSPLEEAYATPVSRTGPCCRGQRATRGRKRVTPYPLRLVSRSSSPALGSPTEEGGPILLGVGIGYPLERLTPSELGFFEDRALSRVDDR